MNERLKAILASNSGIPYNAIFRDSHLSNDLGLDSLDIVDLVLQIEDTFLVSIPDDEYLPLKTAGQIDDYLRVKIATTIVGPLLYTSRIGQSL